MTSPQQWAAQTLRDRRQLAALLAAQDELRQRVDELRAEMAETIVPVAVRFAAQVEKAAKAAEELESAGITWGREDGA